MNAQTADHLSQTFAALADPTRRAMLARLSQGEANVTDLAAPFLKDMSLPAVTKHLKVLEKAGFVLEARFYGTFFKDGIFEDELVYAVRRLVV